MTTVRNPGIFFRRPHGIGLDAHTGRLVTTDLPDRLLVFDPVAQQTLRDHDTRNRAALWRRSAPAGVWPRSTTSCGRHARVGDLALDIPASGARRDNTQGH